VERIAMKLEFCPKSPPPNPAMAVARQSREKCGLRGLEIDIRQARRPFDGGGGSRRRRRLDGSNRVAQLSFERVAMRGLIAHPKKEARIRSRLPVRMVPVPSGTSES